MSRWDSISITAHYTAQLWARQGLPGAARFDTGRGRIFYRLVHPIFVAAAQTGLTPPHEFCLLRHHCIDSLVERIPHGQLIELGCGLSSRCLARCEATGTPGLDVDLPALLALKASLAGSELPPTYRTAALDVVQSEDYAADLGDLLERGTPTVVIAEGLLPYFPLTVQQRIFDRVAALLRSCGGGVFLTDVHHQQELERAAALVKVFRTGLGLVSRTVQHPQIRSFAEGQRMLAQAGFPRVTLHRPASGRAALGLPPRAHDAGLRVYEATIPSRQPA